MTVGNEGLINRSINVAEKTNEESIKEEIELVLAGWEADYHGKGIEFTGRSEETVSKATVTYQDENNVTYEKDGETYIGIIENKKVIKIIKGEKKNVINVKDGVWVSEVPEDNWFSKKSYYDTSWQGEGTQENPYLISSEAELAGLSYEVANGNDFDSTYFQLTKNLNMGEHIWVPIGGRKYEEIESNYYSIEGKEFNGIFDGNGLSIAGIYYNDKSMATGRWVGLFGYSNSYNSKIMNLDIIDSYISGYRVVGGIAGETRAKITNCSNSAIIEGGDDVGGIVGHLYYGEIDNCHNSGNIISLEKYAYSSSTEIGGIVGSFSGTITNVYNLGNITIGENKISMKIGGIAGDLANSAEIYNCYNAGKITVMTQTTSSDIVGGIYGYDAAGTNINNCLNIGDMQCNGEGVGGIAGKYSGGITSNCYYRSSSDCCQNIEFFAVKGNGRSTNMIGRFETLETTEFTYYDNAKETVGYEGNIIQKLNKYANTYSKYMSWKIDESTGTVAFDK